MRSTLADTIVEVSSALAAAPELADRLRVSKAQFDLPVEVYVTGDTLLVNVPRWRWRTDFDEQPSQLRVALAILLNGADDGSL